MKTKLTLSVENMLVELAKDKNMNISEFVEKALALHFRLRKEVKWVSTEQIENPALSDSSLPDIAEVGSDIHK